MSAQHDAACDQITSITQHGRAMGRALIVAIDAMTLIEHEPDAEQRALIHARARNDIHSLIAEVM